MEYWELLDMGAIQTSDTPLGLWKNACRYFKFCDETPMENKEYVKSGQEAGKSYIVEKKRAYNVKALCLFCGIDQLYIEDLLSMQESGGEFFMVMQKILYVISVQNFEFAAAGILNQQFMSKFIISSEPPKRMLPIKVEVMQGLPRLGTSESEVMENMFKSE